MKRYTSERVMSCYALERLSLRLRLSNGRVVAVSRRWRSRFLSELMESVPGGELPKRDA